MNDYDVGQIMQEMEIELIQSMRRNLGRHMAWEEDEGFHWEQWQAKKIRELRKYRAQNKTIMNSYSQRLNGSTKSALRRQYLEGGRKVDKEASRIIKRGFSLYRATPSNDFFQGDNDKLDKLINAITNDMKQAQNAALRQMDDVYRKTIFKAEVFLGGGATTVDKAVDMATKDFLKSGINCITYANGAQVNIASYTRMAVRTANKRVFLMGEGERRKEWGLSLVFVSQYMQCSPLCLPWQGKVYIDDVYSGGKQEDGDYPLLSTAIKGNLFHPNCRHTMSTFFEGISEVPEAMDKEEIGEAYEKAKREAEINRNIQMYKRLKEGSINSQNVSKYDAKLKEWKQIKSSLSSGSDHAVNPISEKSISSMQMSFIDDLSKEENEMLLSKHKELLRYAKDNNESKEVAALFDSDMMEINTILGGESEVDLNISGRGKAEYVIHNHPNNKSFSDRDIQWFVSNENVKYFSIVKNNGNIEILCRKHNFDKDKFITEFKRCIKKYEKDIAKDKQKGYDKVIENLLTKKNIGIERMR